MGPIVHVVGSKQGKEGALPQARPDDQLDDEICGKGGTCRQVSTCNRSQRLP
jgi:hypothetical protein